jgi:hypothetical protein
VGSAKKTNPIFNDDPVTFPDILDLIWKKAFRLKWTPHLALRKCHKHFTISPSGVD